MPFPTSQVSGWVGAQQLHAECGQVVAYKGMMDCFVRTVREEGAGALFKVGSWNHTWHAHWANLLPFQMHALTVTLNLV